MLRDEHVGSIVYDVCDVCDVYDVRGIVAGCDAERAIHRNIFLDCITFYTCITITHALWFMR